MNKTNKKLILCSNIRLAMNGDLVYLKKNRLITITLDQKEIEVPNNIILNIPIYGKKLPLKSLEIGDIFKDKKDGYYKIIEFTSMSAKCICINNNTIKEFLLEEYNIDNEVIYPINILKNTSCINDIPMITALALQGRQEEISITNTLLICSLVEDIKELKKKLL